MPRVGQEEEHSKLKFSCTSAFDGYLMMTVSSILIIILGEGVAEPGGELWWLHGDSNFNFTPWFCHFFSYNNETQEILKKIPACLLSNGKTL